MTSELIRLPKYLARSGLASRRAAERLIADGRVKVNGIPVSEPGIRIDIRHDRVEVDNIPVKNTPERKYYLLFKPVGYLSTVRDPFGRPTVMDLFPRNVRKGLFPVGRLDMDTEGLILLTNDGELAFRLTHPRFRVKKTYQATVKGRPSEGELLRLQKGIILEEGRTAPAEVKVISAGKKKTVLLITIHEGKKRQVKRMCQAVGHPVISLKRVSYAFLNLDRLHPSDYRGLTGEEIRGLYALVGLKP